MPIYFPQAQPCKKTGLCIFWRRGCANSGPPLASAGSNVSGERRTWGLQARFDCGAGRLGACRLNPASTYHNLACVGRMGAAQSILGPRRLGQQGSHKLHSCDVHGIARGVAATACVCINWAPQPESDWPACGLEPSM